MDYISVKTASEKQIISAVLLLLTISEMFS